MVIRAPMDEPKAYCLRWSNHQANLVSVMDDLLVHKKLTDVALGTDDGPLIWCHKVILATCSPYFRKLFIDATSHNPIVLLKDTSYPVVKILLEYMYRGEVNVSQDNVAALLDLAALLQVKGLAIREELNFGIPLAASPSPVVGSTSSNGYEEAHPREASESLGANPSERESERNNGNARLNETIEEPAGRQEIHRNPLPPLIQRWPMAPMALTEEQQSAVAAFANLHPFPATSYSLSQFYQNSSESSCARNPHYQTPQNPPTPNIQDTSILRSVLNPEQIDPTLRLPPNHQEPRNRRHRNRKNRPPQHLQRRSSADLQQMPSTSQESDPTAPLVESEQNRTTPQPSAEPVPSVSGYGGSQRQENKRYKKYDPRDIWMAIAEVQRGLSANKAAEKFKVPSRTLYDKIKKMKTSESRDKQRSRPCETASNVPNVQNDVQGNATTVGLENPANSPNEETMSDSIDNPISMVETSLGEDRERSNVPERSFDSDRESPLPRGNSNANSQPASPGELQIDHNEEEAEDLTVSRRPPNIHDGVSPNSDNEETL